MNEVLLLALTLSVGVLLAPFSSAVSGGRCARVFRLSSRRFGSSAVCCCG